MLNLASLRNMAAALLLLVAAALLLRFYGGPRRPETMASRDFPRKAAYFEITRGSETWKFRCLRQAWTMTEPFEYPANTAEVRGLLLTMANSPVSSPLTRSSASASGFGIGEGVSVSAVFLGDVRNRLLSVATGKEGEQPESFYWRDAAGDIRLAESFPVYMLNRPFPEWLDKTMAFLPGGPAYVRVSGKKTSFSVEQSSVSWHLSEGGRDVVLSSSALNGFLLAFVPSLEADAVLPYRECAAFKEEMTLEVKPSGPELPCLLSVGPLEDDFRRVRKTGEGRVCFLLSEEKLSSLLQLTRQPHGAASRP